MPTSSSTTLATFLLLSASLFLTSTTTTPALATPLTHNQASTSSNHHSGLLSHRAHNGSVHLPITPHRGDTRSCVENERRGEGVVVQAGSPHSPPPPSLSDEEVERRSRAGGEKRKHKSKPKSNSTKKGGNAGGNERGVTVSSANQNWKWSGKKAGLAWPNGDQDGASSWCGSYAGWYYTWSPWNSQSLTDCGLEFVPMLWGRSQISDFLTQQWTWPSSTKHVLFVNEPNQEGQSDMSVGEAVDMWWKYMEPLASRGYKLGLAGTTSAPSGKVWIGDFINACKGCSISFLPLHWYDVNADNFQNYVLDFYNTFNLPIWVTEWACQNFNGGDQCSHDYIYGEFFDKTVGWMNGQDFVERHAWFGAMHNMQNVNYDNQLMSWDGRPNDLGWRYIS